MSLISLNIDLARQTAGAFEHVSNELDSLRVHLQGQWNTLSWTWEGESKLTVENSVAASIDQIRRLNDASSYLRAKITAIADRFESADLSIAMEIEPVSWGLHSLCVNPTLDQKPWLPSDQNYRSILSIDEQIELAKNELKDVPGLVPAEWEKLSPDERLKVLTKVEEVLARVQGRKTVPVQLGELDGELAHFDKDHTIPPKIVINQSTLKNANLPDILDALAHEDRHAYQWFAILHPGFHPDQAEVDRWRANEGDNYIDGRQPGKYLDYRNQPLEADANDYGDKFSDAVDPEGLVSEAGEDIVNWIDKNVDIEKLMNYIRKR